jgi:hypothetical protein
MNLQFEDTDSVRRRHWVAARWAVSFAFIGVIAFGLYALVRFDVKTNSLIVLTSVLLPIALAERFSATIKKSDTVFICGVVVATCVAGVLAETQVRTPLGHGLDGAEFGLVVVYNWMAYQVKKIDGRRERMRSSVLLQPRSRRS